MLQRIAKFGVLATLIASTSACDGATDLPETVRTLRVTPERVELMQGDIVTLDLHLDGVARAVVQFASLNPNIVSVRADGRIEALAAGNGRVVAFSIGQPLVSDTSFVLVATRPPSPPTFMLIPGRVDIAVGDSVRTIVHGNADLDVDYESSDSAVATVSSHGTVRALRLGSATITAMIRSRPEVRASSVVNVVR